MASRIGVDGDGGERRLVHMITVRHCGQRKAVAVFQDYPTAEFTKLLAAAFGMEPSQVAGFSSAEMGFLRVKDVCRDLGYGNQVSVPSTHRLRPVSFTTCVRSFILDSRTVSLFHTFLNS